MKMDVASQSAESNAERIEREKDQFSKMISKTEEIREKLPLGSQLKMDYECKELAYAPDLDVTSVTSMGFCELFL